MANAGGRVRENSGITYRAVSQKENLLDYDFWKFFVTIYSVAGTQRGLRSLGRCGGRC